MTPPTQENSTLDTGGSLWPRMIVAALFPCLAMLIILGLGGAWNWGEFWGAEGGDWLGFWGTLITVAVAVLVAAHELKIHENSERNARNAERRSERAMLAAREAERDSQRQTRERIALEDLLLAGQGLVDALRDVNAQGRTRGSAVGKDPGIDARPWFNAVDNFKNREMIWRSNIGMEPGGIAGTCMNAFKEVIATVEKGYNDQLLYVVTGQLRMMVRLSAEKPLDKSSWLRQVEKKLRDELALRTPKDRN